MTRNSGGHASATAPVNAEPDHCPLPCTVLVPVMAPASGEILDHGQAMAGLGQASRCGPPGRGPRLRAVVDHRDARNSHLIEIAENPKVKVLIVPASADAHVGLTGPFVIAEFRDPPEMAYLDTAAQGQVFDTLRAEALPPRASLDLIAEVRDTWT